MAFNLYGRSFYFALFYCIDFLPFKGPQLNNPIIAKVELIQAMKDLAYWERLNIKEVYEEAIKDRIAKYEKKSGKLLPRPK
ncbi:MAG: hypothetical protein NVS3B8_01870 [Chitinophagaceae bacterium]